MPNAGVKVEIAAEDRITRTLERINKRIENMRAPALRTQKALSRFSELSGLNKVGTGLNRMGQAAKGAFFSLGRIVPVLGVLTSAASIDGIVRLATAWASFGSRLGFSAQRIGVTATQLQSLDGAARLAGSSSGSLQSGLQTLGQGMWDAVGGRAPELVSTFRALHIQFQNADGSAKSVTEVMPQLADKIASIRNPYAQAAVAARLFGGASEDLLPFLRLGSAGIARYSAMAQHYGVTNEAGVLAANRLRMAQAELTLAVEGFGNSIAQSLEPVLTPIIHQMAEWIAHNRAWISTKITDYVHRFAKWLKSIDWDAVTKGAEGVWNRVGQVVKSLGGWKSAAEDVGIAMAVLYGVKVLSGLAGLAGGFGGVGLAIASVAAALIALPPLMDALQSHIGPKNPHPGSDAHGFAGSTHTTRDPNAPVVTPTGSIFFDQLWDATKQAWGATKAAWNASGTSVSARGLGRGVIADARPLGGLLRPNQDLSDMIDAASGISGVDRLKLRALINAESGGAMVGNSASSAFGYMQLTDATAQDEGVDSHNRGQNILGGTRHFMRAMQAAGGDLAVATAAYHDGLNSDGLAWWKSHSGDLSHFSAAARTEADTVGSYYDSERQAAAAGPARSIPSPNVDPAGFWHQARGDLRTIGSASRLIAAAPPVSVPPGTAQGGSIDATIEKLRAELHITVRTQQGTQATVKPGSSSGGLRVASVQTARAMDPEMTPGGY